MTNGYEVIVEVREREEYVGMVIDGQERKGTVWSRLIPTNPTKSSYSLSEREKPAAFFAIDEARTTHRDLVNIRQSTPGNWLRY